MKPSITLVAFAALIAHSSVASRAATVAYDLSGTVHRISNDTSSFSQFGDIHVGDQFTARIALDLSGPTSPIYGTNYFSQAFPPAEYSVSINGLTFKPLPGTTGVADIHPNWYNNQDLFEFETERSLAMPVGYSTSANPVGYFYIWSAHNTVFHDQQLAHIPTFDLANFSSVDFYLAWSAPTVRTPVTVTAPNGDTIVSQQFFEIDFSVASLIPVPEPSSNVLAIVGVVCASVAYRRHRTRALTQARFVPWSGDAPRHNRRQDEHLLGTRPKQAISSVWLGRQR